MNLITLLFIGLWATIVLGREASQNILKPDFDERGFVNCIKKIKHAVSKAGTAENATDKCYREYSNDSSTVGGGHSSDVLRAIFDVHRADLRKCAKVAVDSGHPTKGTLDAVLTVNFDLAEVTSVSFKNGGGSPQLETCVADAIKSWEFPHRPLGDHFKIEWPLVF